MSHQQLPITIANHDDGYTIFVRNRQYGRPMSAEKALRTLSSMLLAVTAFKKVTVYFSNDSKGVPCIWINPVGAAWPDAEMYKPRTWSVLAKNIPITSECIIAYARML